MDYEKFKGMFIVYAEKELKKIFPKIVIKEKVRKKVNKTFDALYFDGIGELEEVSPNIKLNDLYLDYSNGKGFSDLLKEVKTVVFQTMENGDKIMETVSKIHQGDYNDRIICTLVNTEANKEFLESVPNRSFEDMSIIYRICISKPNENDFVSTVVTNDLLEKLKMTEEELYLMAKSNTINLLEPRVEPMLEVIKRICPGFASNEEDFPLLPMYVVSSRWMHEGAVFMLYEEIFDTLVEKLGENLIVLPSSRHEFIAIPDCDDVEELAKMVLSINMTEVSSEDRLSNQVYRWNNKEKRVELASHTEFKNVC